MAEIGDVNVVATLDASQVRRELSDIQQQVDALNALKDAKPGHQTTEFWICVVAIAAVALSKFLRLEADQLWMIAGLAGVYTGGRTMVKRTPVDVSFGKR